MSVSNSPPDRLKSLEALIDGMEYGVDVGLKKLEGLRTPDAIRRKLILLLDGRRYEDAAAFARTEEMHMDWCEVGVSALVSVGDYDYANRLLEYARRHDSSTYRRALLNFHDVTFKRIFEHRGEGAQIFPGTLSSEELRGMRAAEHVILPVVTGISANGRIEDELASELVQRGVDICILLQKHEKVGGLADLLARRSPIPEKVGQLVLNGYIKDVRGIATRLRSDHEQSFRAQLMACLIEARGDRNPGMAFQAAKSLVVLAATETEREELCALLYEIATDLGQLERQQTVQLATELLGPGARLLKYFAADDALANQQFAQGIAILESIRDETDPQWLRLYGAFLLRSDKEKDGVGFLVSAANILPSKELITFAAQAALKTNDSAARELLERLLALSSKNVWALNSLAVLASNSADYKGALVHYRVLREIEPQEVTHAVNIAVSLSYLGKHDAALNELDRFLTVEGTDQLPAILTQSSILRSVGRVEESFTALQSKKNLFWDKPDFLSAYMVIGYAAQKDSEASKAMLHLLELQQQGAVESEVLHSASIEDVKALLSKTVSRRKETAQQIIQGKMLWLAAAEMRNEAAYWAWHLQTQSLRWLSDDPIERAYLCIYSSNGFRALHSNGSKTIEEIEAADKSTSVVIDTSALITCHRLGILDLLPQYFSEILVPARLLADVVNENTKLFPHQLSRKRGLEEIERALSSHRISLQSEWSKDEIAAFELIDEHSPEDPSKPRYHLADLLDAMFRAGRLGSEMYKEAMRLTHRPLQANSSISTLTEGQRLFVELSTLHTIREAKLLEQVLGFVKVVLSPSNVDELRASIRAFSMLEEVQVFHQQLWDNVRQMPKVTFCPDPLKGKVRDKIAKRWPAALLPLALAEERKVPLLVDDRVGQAILQNEWASEKHAAFGTDALLQQFAANGLIDETRVAELLLQLLKWRYRFIVLPAKLLKKLADQYASYPPGDALRVVATYVQDCMMDQGLFAGQEQVTPPTSMAVRLYQTWAQNITEFIVEIWADEMYKDEHAQLLTGWALTSLLPSPPRTLSDPLQARLVALTPRTIIARALIYSIDKPRKRMTKALEAIAGGLGLERTEYLHLVMDVVSNDY